MMRPGSTGVRFGSNLMATAALPLGPEPELEERS